MVIKYRLGFDGDCEDYAYLVSQILQNTNSNVIKAGNEIVIFMEGDEESLKTSFLLLGEKLPLSLYFAGQTVEEAAFMPPNKQSFKERSYFAMYPNLAREMIDQTHERYFDIGASVSVDGEKIVGSEALKIALEGVVLKLENGKSVLIQNESNSFTLSCEKSDLLMLTNLRESTLFLFGISNDEALTLSSMERPFVLKLLEDRFGLVCFANDALMFLLSKLASDRGINALYISNSSDAQTKVSYSGVKGDAPKRQILFFAGSNRFFVNADFTAEAVQTTQSSIFANMNISKDFGVYAIKEKGVFKKIVGASFFDTDILASIGVEFEFGSKLAANFEKKFPTEAKTLREFCGSGEAMQDFFSSLALLFGSNGAFSYVVSLANRADIKGGVKLDFVLEKDENGVALNLKKCFASILSYKLAGVENSTLAYSVFESAVDFLILSQDEAKKSFEIKRLFVGGDFLLSNVFVFKLKSKIKTTDIEMALNRVPANLQGVCEIAK